MLGLRVIWLYGSAKMSCNANMCYRRFEVHRKLGFSKFVDGLFLINDTEIINLDILIKSIIYNIIGAKIIFLNVFNE